MKARVYTGNLTRTVKEGLTTKSRTGPERKRQVLAPGREGRISPVNSKEHMVAFHHQTPHRFSSPTIPIRVKN